MWSQVSQSLHESMARVISRIATLLPGILAFILAVLFFAAIAFNRGFKSFGSRRSSMSRCGLGGSSPGCGRFEPKRETTS